MSVSSSERTYSHKKAARIPRQASLVVTSHNHYKFCGVQWLDSVQFSSFTQLCLTLGDPMDSMPGFPVYYQLPELTQTYVHWVGDVIQTSHPLWSLLLPPSIFPSIRVFSNDLVLWFRRPKFWSFSFSISLSNEYSRLISFRMDWLDLLAVQRTLKSLIQHHSSKASILQHSAFWLLEKP